MKGYLAVLIVGMVLGGVTLSFGQGFFGVNSISYAEAATPAFHAVGSTVNTPEELARALNPCIRPGTLPVGCEVYIDNGRFLQPPIKIILDDPSLATN